MSTAVQVFVFNEMCLKMKFDLNGMPVVPYVIQLGVHVTFIGLLIQSLAGGSLDGAFTGRNSDGVLVPGGYFAPFTNWVLTAQALYFICVFIFNVAQPFVSKPAEVFWRHHIDRWYFLMFTQCAGMGGYFLLDWIFNCHGSDSGCSWDSLHGNGILWAHVEALVWAVAEFVAIPHSLRHGPWWIELAMALLLSLAWSLHYATFHALTNGLWVYGDPWSAGFFAMFFLIPLVHLIGAGLSLLRGLLYRCLAARWPKPFGWQLTLYEDASSTQVCVCWPRSRRGNVLDTVSVPLDTQSESLLGVTAADAPEPLHDGKADHGCMPYCISCSVGMLWPVWATVCAGLFVVAMFDIVYAIECSR